MTEFCEKRREKQRQIFLKDNGLSHHLLISLPGDASKRRYFRLPSLLLMDDPSKTKDTIKFERIARILKEAGLSTPSVYVADHENGFLLIEDWGNLTYRNALKEADEKTLYEEAINALIHLHQNMTTQMVTVPSYSIDTFINKASLFTDWFDAHFSNQDKDDFRNIWKQAFENQPQIPHSLALRDVMVDNLMWLPDREGINRCGFLDFQDASWAPVTYDLVSLLMDARRDVPPSLANEMLDLYVTGFPNLNRYDFDASYALWGAQRTTRILGVFYRLARRDGKTQYLQYIPRLKANLTQNLLHPCLSDLKKWFEGVEL